MMIVCGESGKRHAQGNPNLIEEKGAAEEKNREAWKVRVPKRRTKTNALSFITLPILFFLKTPKQKKCPQKTKQERN